ncbi:Alpha-N-methyltransferase NTM1 [Rhypophila sp. PSN 637]
MAENSTKASIKYWEGVNADVDGMLGGIPQVPEYAHIDKVDIQSSKNLLAKLGFGGRKGLRLAENALEGGAGIGRVTEALLVKVAKQVDVIEPLAKFTAGLQGKPGIRNIFNVGLEDWRPNEGDQYDLIWTQWCVGYLDDEQLVDYLKRCKEVLTPKTGVLVIKENIATDNNDVWDETDSSVTRADVKFHRIFKQAGMRLVKSEIQRGLPQNASVTLFPIYMYALKPE